MFILRTKGLSESVSLHNLPTIRQAFVIAALIIFLAFVLAHSLHPDFVYLALLPAFGLLLSGTVGFCPLVFFLQLLPGNRGGD